MLNNHYSMCANVHGLIYSYLSVELIWNSLYQTFCDSIYHNVCVSMFSLSLVP